MERLKQATVISGQEVAPRGKKLIASLLDAVLVFLVSSLLFLGVLGVYTGSNYYKAREAETSLAAESIVSLVSESRLSRIQIDENGNRILVNPDEVANDFALGAVYRETYNAEEGTYSSLAVFSGLDSTVDYDVLGYYYGEYMPAHASDYSSGVALASKEQFQTNFLLDIENDVNGYFYLKDGSFRLSSIYVNRFLAYYSGESGGSISFLNKIESSYLRFLKDAISNYMSDYRPYAELEGPYSQSIDQENLELVGLLMLTHLFVVGIYYIALPLILKKGRTPFMIVFKLCLVGVDDTPVAWWQILIKGIILFFLYLPMPCLYALMELGFLSGFSVLVTDFLGIFNLFALGSLMGLVLLCSIFFTFFRKEKKQTFSELASLTKVYEERSVKIIHVGGQKFEVHN